MNPPVASRRWLLIASLAILALIIAGYALRSNFQHGHGHEHAHDHGAATLALNGGQRWETDEPLRLGMQRIRDAISHQNAPGKRPSPPRAELKALADTVQENVSYLIQNCRLEPQADANLHLIINDLMAGAALLTTEGQSGEGLVKLRHALSEYPRYFNHPNWNPLPASTP